MSFFLGVETFIINLEWRKLALLFNCPSPKYGIYTHKSVVSLTSKEEKKRLVQILVFNHFRFYLSTIIFLIPRANLLNAF